VSLLCATLPGPSPATKAEAMALAGGGGPGDDEGSPPRAEGAGGPPAVSIGTRLLPIRPARD
jgi:hypothetical protein